MTRSDRRVKGFVVKNQIMDDSYAEHTFTGYYGCTF